MANTTQIVQWALEMRCLLRDVEEAVTCPGKAMSAVSAPRAYSQAFREGKNGFGNYGDVHVSSYTYGTRPGGRKAGRSPYYPASGFVISKKFQRFGGLVALAKVCSDCPANVRPHELAACVGTLPQWPDSPDTEKQLRGIISRLGLEHAVADAFPATTPLWYGLWAISPVPHSSLSVLKTLLSEMLEEDRAEMMSKGEIDNGQLEEFNNFVSAVDIAASKNLKLQVKLLPLGHTDFGIYTVFPHCPFCKASARVERWQRKYPTEHHTCHVCGTKFSPGETASTERMHWDLSDLRDTLGQEHFEAFAKDYLIANGETADAAAAIVRETEAEELRREEQIRRNEELERLRQQYLEENVFIGLDDLPSPPSEFDEEAPETGDKNSCTGWFSAENLAVVLDRCQDHGIKITMMQHRSSNGAFDRCEMRNLKSPLDVLYKWQADGCNEMFHAICRVPDSLVN